MNLFRDLDWDDTPFNSPIFAVQKGRSFEEGWIGGPQGARDLGIGGPRTLDPVFGTVFGSVRRCVRHLWPVSPCLGLRGCERVFGCVRHLCSGIWHYGPMTWG